MKKSISILLSTALIISAMPLNAFAKDNIKTTELRNGANYVTMEK